MTADLLRVLSLWRGRAGWLLAGMAMACGAVLAGLALLGLAGRGVAEGVTQAAVFTGGAAALIWLRPVIILRPLLRYLERLVTHAATFRALADTRIWFFRRLAERLPAGLGFRRAGDLLGRLVSDIDALDRVYLGALVPGVAGVAAVLAIALILGAIDPALAALVALPLALALLLPPLLAPGAAAAGQRVAESQGALRAVVVDPLTGIEDTLAAGAEPRASARVAREGVALAEAQRALARRGAWGGAAGALLGQAAMLGALGYGLAMGEAGVAAAVLGLFLATAAGEALGLMPRAGAALAAAGASARRLFEAADQAPPVAEPTTPAAMPKGHAIRIRDLQFAWTKDGPPVFEGLDLDVPEGARIALLGPSGIGKSTLASLLLKLAAPQSGSITLGGADLATLPADAVRARIACLTQDARLFDDSIEANLRIGRPEAEEGALWQALDRAGIGEVVRSLPEGLATRCGEAGARFSGGQARRLVLARALLSEAPVLILDEPAAGLDPETERAFLETLGEATAGRSVILIVHRLVGVERPTRILRLAAGRAMPAMG
ncbi:thiol reductant ABC exporter subunit CydC [Falsiroseomonas tokyonensis]|uniref:Thiol reductant ABC exporter subunit CydC n=1 Tax=Falsiroseomonas tokyonensis TaxID=430521 RepID=A0ABV7BQC0_9PROT|nr:thiol reductant ABC exporter subunit CydC [Falsiroseomonas tokyonensis]MBU8537777.1 thiol reductant ABC exporter subunit CydC [Falsiroseomonas tokyonensis]